MAMQNLARMAGINYIIDPKLFTNPNGSPKPEPSLTFQWNCTATEALARVAKENNLVMATNAFTTVVFITDTNHVANIVDMKLLGNDTNGAIPFIVFDDVPLNEALKSFINQAHFKAVLDPQVSGEAAPAPPDYKMVVLPMVSVRWENLTAQQALAELCEAYGLAIVKDSTPDTLLIKPKK